MVLSSFSPKLSRGGTTIRHEREAEMEPSYDADVCASWQKNIARQQQIHLKVLTSWLQEIINRNFPEYALVIVSLGSYC